MLFLRSEKLGISIHAPRTGSDGGRYKNNKAPDNFNPRSPHGERPVFIGFPPPSPNFNPRSPHGERLREHQEGHPHHRISIHAPRTGSDGRRRQHPKEGKISIHAPRTGSDALMMVYVSPRTLFQSTLPARGATESQVFMMARR